MKVQKLLQCFIYVTFLSLEKNKTRLRIANFGQGEGGGTGSQWCGNLELDRLESGSEGVGTGSHTGGREAGT